jgi:hypothetical protein
MVRYPAPGMTPSTPREDWPRLPGVIECQCGPGEWTVTVSRPGNGRWSAARARPGDDALLLVEAEGELVRGHAHELAERGSHRITLIPVTWSRWAPPAVEVAVGDHVTCTVEEVGVLRNQVIAERGAVGLLLQLLEEPDWRHGERETSSDDR